VCSADNTVFTWLSSSLYCADRAQNLPAPARDSVLRVLQISRKPVHFRRSYLERMNTIKTGRKVTVKNSSITTKHLYLILTFRSHHEIFIRRSWYSVLPSLDVTISCRVKKAVVGVTQLVTALVSIHSTKTFLSDM